VVVKKHSPTQGQNNVLADKKLFIIGDENVLRELGQT